MANPALVAVTQGVTYPIPIAYETPTEAVYSTAIGSITLNISYNKATQVFTFSHTGTITDDVEIFDLTSRWTLEALEAFNLGRAEAWVEGDDGGIYELKLKDQIDGGPILSAKYVGRKRPVNDLKRLQSSGFTIDAKHKLTYKDEASGPIIILTNSDVDGSPRTLSVRKVDGEPEVYQVQRDEGATTPPLYIYLERKLIVETDQKGAYDRWDEQDELVDLAQRDGSGSISFTNLPNESLDAGHYTLTIDAGNLGEADPKFKGFKCEVTIGSVSFPVTLLNDVSPSSDGYPFIFAVGGNHGNTASTAVSDQILKWKPEEVLSIGNNSSGDYDIWTGQKYQSLIYPYEGAYGEGGRENRFWPALGAADNVGNFGEFFALPGNERYYDFVRGDVHFFVLNSNQAEPDFVLPGTATPDYTPNSTQGEWLRSSLAASTAKWKIVYFYHSPYSSTSSAVSSWMQWPFESWGVSLVITGRARNYERLRFNGLTYINAGASGATHQAFNALDARHIAGVDDVFGALRFQVKSNTLIGEFISTDLVVLDTFEISAIRGKTSVEFDYPEELEGPWSLNLNWTNDADVSNQGFSRKMAIYGYTLEKAVNDLYSVEISTNPSAEYPVITNINLEGFTSTADLPPGGWLARYNSEGEIYELVHESKIFPSNDTFESKLPLSELYTGLTADRREDILLQDLQGDEVEEDPGELIPEPLLGSITLPGGTHNVGDEVEFSVEVDSNGASTYAGGATYNKNDVVFYDSTYYLSLQDSNVGNQPDENPFWWEKKSFTFHWTVGTETTYTFSPSLTITLNVSGSNLPVNVTVVDYKGRSDSVATSTFDVNQPPYFTSIVVEDTNGIPPYDTDITVTAIDPEGDDVVIHFYEGNILLDTVDSGDVFTYTVRQSSSLRAVAEDENEGTSEIPIEFRGALNRPPVASIQASSTKARIGKNQKITFTGLANDPDNVGDLVFVWKFWDGTTRSEVGEVFGNPLNRDYASVVDFDISNEVSGVKEILLTVIDGDLASSSARLNVELTNNGQPVISQIVNNTNGSAIAGSSVTFDATASDPDGDAITYSWNFVSHNLILTENPVTVSTITSDKVDFSIEGSLLNGVLPNTPVRPGFVTIRLDTLTVRDDGLGKILSPGIVDGIIDYKSGQYNLRFNAPRTSGHIFYSKQIDTIRGTLTVSDSLGAIDILPIPEVTITSSMAITSSTAETVTVGQDFEYKIQTDSQQSSVIFTVGQLPDGLELNGGRIIGKPSFQGTYQIDIQADDGQSVDTHTLTLTVVAENPIPPASPVNLRVFESGNPTYTTGQDLPIAWSNVVDPSDPLGRNLPSTLIEFRDEDGKLVNQVIVDSGRSTYTLSNDDLVSGRFYGSEVDVYLRAYGYRDGIRSVEFDSVVVTLA